MEQYKEGDFCIAPAEVRVNECERAGWAIECEMSGYPAPSAKVGNNKPKGLFAFSLTASPKDSLTSEDLVTAVTRLMAQKTCPVKRFVWYLETKAEGMHPHIHGCYECESQGVIFNKVFKRYWPIWDPSNKMGKGFRGGFHEPVDFPTAYLEYIAKDLGVSDEKGFLSL